MQKFIAREQRQQEGIEHGISLEPVGHREERRKGMPFAGLAATVAMMGVLAFGATGCNKAKAPNESQPKDRQESVDHSFQARKSLAVGEAQQRLRDAAEIRNLRAAGILKPGQEPLRFGDMWISPSDEPQWYRMTRANAAGIANYSDRAIRERMAEDYKSIKDSMGNVKSDYKADLDRNNFTMLSEHLKPGAQQK